MKVILHQFPQSHFCVRIRYALAYKEIPFEVINYKLSTLESLRDLTGGYRKVPVLQWQDQFICDSPVIARFLEKQQPSPSLYPGHISAAQCDMINAWVDTKVMLTAAKFLVKDYLPYLSTDKDRAIYSERFKLIHGIEVEQAIANHAQYGPELMEHWRLLEEALNEKPFILGDQMSYADFGVASRLRLMQIVNRYELPRELAKARAWFQKIARLAD